MTLILPAYFSKKSVTGQLVNPKEVITFAAGLGYSYIWPSSKSEERYHPRQSCLWQKNEEIEGIIINKTDQEQ
jgi:hypothetical protein